MNWMDIASIAFWSVLIYGGVGSRIFRHTTVTRNIFPRKLYTPYQTRQQNIELYGYLHEKSIE